MRIILCALVLAAFAGPGQAATASTAATRKIVNSTDGQILTAIRAKLVKSKVGADRFSVTVQNGVATIEGKTNVVQHKGVATRIARTSGATAVRNNIQISDAGKAKAAATLRRSETATTPTSTTVAAPGGKTATKAAAANTAAFAPPPPALARAAVIPPSQ